MALDFNKPWGLLLQAEGSGGKSKGRARWLAGPAQEVKRIAPVKILHFFKLIFSFILHIDHNFPSSSLPVLPSPLYFPFPTHSSSVSSERRQASHSNQQSLAIFIVVEVFAFTDLILFL